MDFRLVLDHGVLKFFPSLYIAFLGDGYRWPDKTAWLAAMRAKRMAY